ncbi:energy transducer TonB [Sphingomonas sp. DC1600-2]|uniref:energy transducer TonB n=2 Tax=Sphingomonas TaxID=13687 RepID=UPI003CE67ACF
MCQSTAHPPTPRDMGSWIKGDHYPTAAFVARAEGRTAIVLTVQPNGRPSDCKIAESSGNADLDKATCNLFRKGRFNPAIDDTGTKVVGEWKSSMRWKLPG